MKRLILGFYHVLDLYKNGCIVVSTPENLSKPLIRTTIQPDGDVVNVVTCQAMEEVDVIKEHFGKIQAKMGDLRCFRKFCSFLGCVLIAAVLAVCYSAFSSFWGWAGLLALNLGSVYLNDYLNKQKHSSLFVFLVYLGVVCWQFDGIHSVAFVFVGGGMLLSWLMPWFILAAIDYHIKRGLNFLRGSSNRIWARMPR